VTLPPGFVVTGADARFTASGDAVPLTTKGNTVSVSVPLRGDLELEVRVGASR